MCMMLYKMLHDNDDNNYDNYDNNNKNNDNEYDNTPQVHHTTPPPSFYSFLLITKIKPLIAGTGMK